MSLIPNIYASPHYKLLLVIPFIFLVISAYLVLVSPGIPAGVDLRGGILITLQTNSVVNEDALKTSMTSALDVHDVDVKVAPSASGGTGVEITIEQNEKLAAAERALRKFYEAYDKFTSADYDVTSLSNALRQGNLTDEAAVRARLSTAEQQRAAAEADMNASTQIIVSSLTPFVGPIDTTGSATELRDTLSEAYAQAKGVYQDRVLSTLRQNVEFTDFTYKDVSPSLSEFFLQKTMQVVIISFVLTAIMVLAIFRAIIPSFAVVFGALNNIVFALGAMALFQVPFTIASLGALLMLIGFALDTNVLLTVRVVKRTEGTASERAYGAMKTGLMMEAAAFCAFTLLLILAIVTQIPTYYQISVVALAGIFGDVIATWCTNGTMILWHMEKKQKH